MEDTKTLTETLLENLREARLRRFKLTVELSHINKIIDGTEQWLKLNNEPVPPDPNFDHLSRVVEARKPAAGVRQQTLAIPDPQPVRRAASAAKGDVSVRSAVAQVLRDAKGQPLHTSEIHRRVEALGAKTESKDPLGVIDLHCYSLAKREPAVQKVGRRTWRWAAA